MPSASSMQLKILSLGGNLLTLVSAKPSWRCMEVLAMLRQTGTLAPGAQAQIFHGHSQLTNSAKLTDFGVQDGSQLTLVYVPEDSFHRLQKWMSGEEPELNRTKEGTVMVDMAGFLLEKLKAAERRSLKGSVTMRARDQGLFDVLMTKEEHNSESFTRLHVVLVPGDRCIEDGQSPYRIGYVYYVQAQRDKELAEEFHKHLPSVRQTFVEKFPVSTEKVIYRINASFADGSFPEAFETLAARFLAAFFRILEDKS